MGPHNRHSRFEVNFWLSIVGSVFEIWQIVASTFMGGKEMKGGGEGNDESVEFADRDVLVTGVGKVTDFFFLRGEAYSLG